VAPRAEAAIITFSSQGDSDKIIQRKSFQTDKKVIGKIFSFFIIPFPYAHAWSMKRNRTGMSKLSQHSAIWLLIWNLESRESESACDDDSRAQECGQQLPKMHFFHPALSLHWSLSHSSVFFNLASRICRRHFFGEGRFGFGTV
jgi:hypothetical protein